MNAVTEEMKNKYLIFDVDESYALELGKVLEIIELAAVTAVPETPDYISGVINLRGHVVPVVDLRVRFRKAPGVKSSRQCIVVVDFDGVNLGLIVDNVVDLVTIDEDSISPPPQVGTEYAHVFIKEIGIYNGEMKLIVDGDKIINHSDLEFLND